jgi:phosphoribosylformimino-5-aminoimidazole carboxamide ribotide isomerase
MEVIGVLDLRRGQAVHAVAGDRERYVPARMDAHPNVVPGDALAIAGAYIRTLGVTELYVADLDAIVHRTPQETLVRELAGLGLPLWLDAGIASDSDARAAVDCGARRLVVGTETLTTFAVLKAICAEVGRERVVFSLDLRNREPITPSADLATLQLEDLVIRAADAGIGSVIVLDLARVGTQAGPDFEVIERVRAAVPRARLIAGGGVRGRDDLASLKHAGCYAALVGTALLNGRLTAHDIHALRSLT